LNKPTVDHLKQVIHGFAVAYQGVGAKANRGFYYLNPFLSTSRRVFGELNSDQANLEGLVVDAAGLTSTLDQKSPEISSLVANLNGMLGTIGAQQDSLASAVGQLPDFMRQFNTTAVNLRAALDDVQPLINATRPVAPKLQPFTKRLRGFARDSVPTVKGLSGIIKQPGAANDLIELTRLQDSACGDRGRPDQPERFFAPWRPAGVGRLAQELARPDLDAAGVCAGAHRLVRRLRALRLPDAFGGIGRISTTLNTFSVGAPSAGVPCNSITEILKIPSGTSICQSVGGSDLLSGLGTKYLQRCPGSNERGLSEEQLTQGGTVDCNPNQTPLGP
jgi:hypothetical protein